MKKWIILFGLIILAGIGYAQVAGIPSLPPSFSYTLPQLPAPQSPNQIIFDTCKYIEPLELDRVDIYSVGGTALQPEITAQIKIYTNNRKTHCSFKKTYTLLPAINSSGLVSNFQNALNNELISQASANITPAINPSPISSSN